MTAAPASAVEALSIALMGRNRQRATEPIRLPTPEGAFPDSLLVSPSLVVPDANVLRNDILYASRYGRRTVLVTAANAGLLRLFCAQHVVDEVFKHARKWTAGSNVSTAAFLERWTHEYLPHLRVVPDVGPSWQLLSPAEATRLGALGDLTDLPSATLAVLLGAYFLSEDIGPLRAVYGPSVDRATHHAWQSLLVAGSVAGDVRTSGGLLANVVAAIAGGFVAGARRPGGALLIGSLIGLAVVGVILDRERGWAVGRPVASAATSAAVAMSDVSAHYQAAAMRFASVTPPEPDVRAIAVANGADAALARACLRALARSPGSDRSAAELARQLPGLPVARGADKVRATLRRYPCFAEVFSGRWQVGEVARGS